HARSPRSAPSPYTTLFRSMAALGIVGVVADQTNGLPVRIPAELRGFMLDGSETARFWRSEKCLLKPDQSASEFSPDCAGTGRHRSEEHTSELQSRFDLVCR